MAENDTHPSADVGRCEREGKITTRLAMVGIVPCLLLLDKMIR